MNSFFKQRYYIKPEARAGGRCVDLKGRSKHASWGFVAMAEAELGQGRALWRQTAGSGITACLWWPSDEWAENTERTTTRKQMKHLANFIQAQRSVWCNAIYSGTSVRFGTRPNEVFFECLFREKYDKLKDETEKEIFIAKKRLHIWQSEHRRIALWPPHDAHLLTCLLILTAHLVHRLHGTQTTAGNFSPICPELPSFDKWENDGSSSKILPYSFI